MQTINDKELHAHYITAELSLGTTLNAWCQSPIHMTHLHCQPLYPTCSESLLIFLTLNSSEWLIHEYNTRGSPTLLPSGGGDCHRWRLQPPQHFETDPLALRQVELRALLALAVAGVRPLRQRARLLRVLDTAVLSPLGPATKGDWGGVGGGDAAVLPCLQLLQQVG